MHFTKNLPVRKTKFSKNKILKQYYSLSLTIFLAESSIKKNIYFKHVFVKNKNKLKCHGNRTYRDQEISMLFFCKLNFPN